MNHEQSLFWLLALLATLFAAPRAEAAITVTPVLNGFSRNASGGYYNSTQNVFNSGMRAYTANALVPVGGRTITVPAKIPLAANAGNLIKSAMRLNPWVIGGTLAAGWLIDQGIEWIDGDWRKLDDGIGWCYGLPQDLPNWTCSLTNQIPLLSTPQDACAAAIPGGTAVEAPSVDGWNCHRPNGNNAGPLRKYTRTPQQQPVSDDDWDALSDPTDVVAPELPNTPYMPQGVPVDIPEYESSTQPLGSPYTAPDGSTRQDHVHITNNYNTNTVTITTSTTTITDSNGDPVPDPEPVETEPQQSECEKHPTTIGCAEFGTPEAMPTIPVTEIPIDATPTPIGTAGTCPADVTVFVMGKPITISYAPICDFSGMIRPLVIGFAWLGFAFVVAGVVRS